MLNSERLKMYGMTHTHVYSVNSKLEVVYFHVDHVPDDVEILDRCQFLKKDQAEAYREELLKEESL